MSQRLQDMLAVAVRAEIESKDVYNALADQMKNFILKDKFRFLASEEAAYVTGVVLPIDGGLSI